MTRAAFALLATAAACELPPEGARWSVAQALGERGADKVAIAVGDDGRGVAAWLASSSEGRVLVVAEESGRGTWSLSSQGEGLSGAPEAPHVAAGPGGRALTAYGRSDGDTSAVYALERDSDGRWTDVVAGRSPLSMPPRAYEPRASIGATGEAVIVWNQWSDPVYGVMLARRRGPDVDWALPASAGEALSVPIFYANAPQVAQSVGGDLLVTWYQSTGGPLMVYASERRGLDGTPTLPAADAPLSAAGAPVDSHPIANPRPAFGPRGEAAVVWTQENGRGDTLVYLAVRDLAAGWTRPESLDDALSLAGAVARCPQGVFRASGELVAIWQEERDGALAVLGVRLEPGARAAAPDTIETLSSPDVRAYSPAIAASGDEVVATWVEDRGASAVVVARRLGAGWAAAETLSPAASGAAADPAIAAGGGRIIVAWPEGPTSARRLHVAALE